MTTTAASGPGSNAAAANAHTELRSMLGVSSDWRRIRSTPSDASVLTIPATASTARMSGHGRGCAVVPSAKPSTSEPAASRSTNATTNSARRGNAQSDQRVIPIGSPRRCCIPMSLSADGA
jgi:hypothetical protein